MGEVMYSGWETEREITITAGTGDLRQQFRGRRDLLTEASGYFKSLLESSGAREVAVPSVSPDVFSRILTFVNTGLLDLTPDNIYSVLLATHLLHMPRALELCRSYLVLERHRLLSTPPTPSIVKPIPSRKFFFWPHPPPFFPLPPPPPPAFSSLYIPPPIVPPLLELEPLPSTSVPAPPSRQDTAGPSSPQNAESGATSDKGVYKDIACCDGPVRFKRVLNVNYGTFQASEASAGRSKSADEARKRVFICSFCKHTFKSHYCFRKHTRRHLNPVPFNPATTQTPENDVKDMNVQYYPCKTCGSKFPSYYFVHKHRKMCHGSENYSENKSSPTNNLQHDELRDD